MAKQKTPVTTTTLAAGPPGAPPEPEFPAPPPAPLDAPPPGEALAPKPARKAAVRELTEYRVLVRHCPLPRHKALTVKAADAADAWAAYQDELERMLSAEGEPGKKALGAFKQWLSQQPPHRTPAEVEVIAEAEYQRLRREARERRPQPVRA